MKGKVVLITGASSGIGRETAYRFARAGALLVLTYNKGKARGEAVERMCLNLGAAEVTLAHLDVMDNRSISALATKVRRKYGRVDVLINNAAVAEWNKLMEQSVRSIERQVRTNLEGPIKMIRAFMPMVTDCIINVASMAGQMPFPEMAPYCGTKFGLRGFTQGLAVDYPKPRICAVNPDLTATQMTGYEGRPPEEAAETIYRAAIGKAGCRKGADVDVNKVIR